MKKQNHNKTALITTIDQFGAIVATKMRFRPSYSYEEMKAKAIKKMRKERLI